jgi:hypothetical protein
LKSASKATNSFYEFEYSKPYALLDSIYYKITGSPDGPSNKLLVEYARRTLKSSKLDEK